MNADEISQFSESIAWHPVVAIGGLMILVSIARRMDLKYKEDLKVVENDSQESTINLTEKVNSNERLLQEASSDTSSSN